MQRCPFPCQALASHLTRLGHPVVISCIFIASILLLDIILPDSLPILVSRPTPAPPPDWEVVEPAGCLRQMESLHTEAAWLEQKIVALVLLTLCMLAGYTEIALPEPRSQGRSCHENTFLKVFVGTWLVHALLGYEVLGLLAFVLITVALVGGLVALPFIFGGTGRPRRATASSNPT